MSTRTLTRADLLQIVYVTVPGLSRVDAKDIVEATLDTLCHALVEGESVKLRGFGTFNLRAKRPRVGRNPKTGEEYPITARRVLTFRPSPRLIAAVNGELVGPADEADDETDGRRPASRAAAVRAGAGADFRLQSPKR